MAHRELKEKVLEMRKQGMSYSQIKAVVKVSKGTLSLWLRDMPLSREKINELRALNPQRIERYRNTMAAKRRVRLDDAYRVASKEIGVLNSREIFLCGLFLYWGEGTKIGDSTVEITNTDPAMIKFTLSWFENLGISKNLLVARLKIYKDTNVEEITDFWSNILGFKKDQFRFHIKNTNQADITYKSGYGHCTCSISYGSTKLRNHIMQSLVYIKKHFL